MTGVGANLREAVDRAYARVAGISFDKMFYRKDIAHRAFERDGDAGKGPAKGFVVSVR